MYCVNDGDGGVYSSQSFFPTDETDNKVFIITNQFY